MSAILGLLHFLPAAIELGVQVGQIVTDTLAKDSPKTEVQSFAAQALAALPALLQLGTRAMEVKDIVTRTNAEVRLMMAEGRGPTTLEWNAQADRIKALEKRLDAAGT